MSDLTFTSTNEYDGALRRWDLTGPAGVVRFEVAEALMFVSPSVYLMPVAGEPDALVSRLARQLHQDWLEHKDEQVIRDQLEKWYGEFVAVSS